VTWADGNEDMLEAFFIAGASVDAKDRSGATSLASAACLNHVRSARRLLRNGANIDNLDAEGDSPLFEAIRYCNAEVAELLLDHGAKVNPINRTGKTVLHVLASMSNQEGQKFLCGFRTQA
jgi:ankyrin repeat protein